MALSISAGAAALKGYYAKVVVDASRKRRS
jgi:hypothetical protein